MAIALDHLFICCEPGGPEAQALLDIGLVEGSGNVHAGQGTANRRFFFQDGFLELLWVHDPEQAQSPLTAPTRLWQRWSTRKAGSCPFGVAFRPAGSVVDTPPFDTWTYSPGYLPKEKQILFAQNTSLQEPELFYLAWPHPQLSAAAQPKDHPNGLRRLLSTSVGLPVNTPLSAASMAVQAAGVLQYHVASQYELKLTFTGRQAVVFDLSPTLPLVLSAIP
jgi:hypothetical protein